MRLLSLTEYPANERGLERLCKFTKFMRYLILSWALSGFFFSCSGNDFSGALSTAVKAAGDGPIVFGDLTSFKWDTVYVYGPYRSLEEINKKQQ